MKTCPVCRKHNVPENITTCPICGFDDFRPIIVSDEEYEYWLAASVNPARMKWEFERKESHLKAELFRFEQNEMRLKAELSQKKTELFQKEKEINTLKEQLKKQTALPPTPIIGSVIQFGGYNWRVLDIQNNAALIITENVIEKRAYHNKLENITWADCDLRKYLNGEFLSNFSPFEIAKIIPVPNLNPNNPWWGTNGGAETTDRVFLLSLQEVCRYFGDSRVQLNSSAKKSLAAEIKREYWDKGKTKWDEWKDFYLDNKIYVTDENNSKRMLKYGNESSWWWLRSPGNSSINAAFVYDYGVVNVTGSSVDDVNYVGGVRPALWLKL